MKEKFITICKSQGIECLDESKFIKPVSTVAFYKVNPIIDYESIKAALDEPGVIQQWNDPTATIIVNGNYMGVDIIPQDLTKYVGIYIIDDKMHLPLEKRPHWLHRLLSKMFLNWQWEDR